MKQMMRYILISSLVISMVPTSVLATDQTVPSPPVVQVVPDKVDELVDSDEPQLPLGDVSPVEVVKDSEVVASTDVADFKDVADEVVLSAPPADSTDESEGQPVATRLLISEVLLRGCLSGGLSCSEYSDGGHEGSFIELYNPSPSEVNVSGWELQYVVASGDEFGGTTSLAAIDVHLNGYGYAVVGREGLAVPPDTVLVPLLGKIGNKSQGYLRLVDESNRMIDLVGWGSASLAEGGGAAKAPDANNSIQRCEDSDGLILDTDLNAADFIQYEFTTPGSGVYCVEPDVVSNVNECEGVLISEIAANVAADRQFIELRNSTADDILIGGCLLQTNRSTTKTFALPDETIAPGGYSVVYIRDTELVLTKTTTGVVYLLTSDGQSEVDVRSYANLAVDTSWSWFGGDVWQQTYVPTPEGDNVRQLYAACDEGYLRNLETGRCNKVAVAAIKMPCRDGQYRSAETGRCRNVTTATSLVPCRDGQYRSEQTNRCRNIALAGSTLAPCRDNQYRSETTNRCRLIASAASSLVPCKDNQYRSEETNRCRTIVATSIPAAAFAVEPIADTGKAFVGWWILGGVGLIAVGYGAWEWRREMMASIRKLGTFVRSGK